MFDEKNCFIYKYYCILQNIISNSVPAFVAYSNIYHYYLIFSECYSQYCVPDFVACSRESDDIYDMCKVEHDLCASKCFDSGSDQVK